MIQPTKKHGASMTFGRLKLSPIFMHFVLVFFLKFDIIGIRLIQEKKGIS